MSGFNSKFFHTFREQVPFLLKLSPNLKEVRYLANSFHDTGITLTKHNNSLNFPPQTIKRAADNIHNEHICKNSQQHSGKLNPITLKKQSLTVILWDLSETGKKMV